VYFKTELEASIGEIGEFHRHKLNVSKVILKFNL
jgi:hypothetical protein